MAAETYTIGGVEFSFDRSDWHQARKRLLYAYQHDSKWLAVTAARKLTDMIRHGRGPAKSDRNSGTFKVLGVRVRYRAVEQQS